MAASESARISALTPPPDTGWRRMWRPFWTLPVAMISVTWLVFSVTIVVLQLASSQFTPRIIPQFLASRITQGTLGFFLATFIFALPVMRAVRGSNENLTKFVPDVAVTVAFLLVLISVGYFLAFIHNITSSIQVCRIISRLGESTVAVADRVYPETGDAAGQDDPDRASGTKLSADATWSPSPDASRTDIAAPHRYGRVTSIDYPTLADAADAIDAVIVIEIDHGQFVAEGDRVGRRRP